MKTQKQLLVADEGLAGKARAKKVWKWAEHFSRALDLTPYGIHVHSQDARKSRPSHPKVSLRQSDSPVDVLLSEMESRSPFAVVLGTKGVSGVKALWMGSVSEEVVRATRVPAIVIGPKVGSPAANALKKKRILLGLDLEQDSAELESFCVSLARGLGAELVIFHSLYASAHPVVKQALSSPQGRVQLKSWLNSQVETLELELERVADRLRGQGIRVQVELWAEPGEVDQQMLKLLRSKKDAFAFAVLSTHRRGRFWKHVVGHTVRKLVFQSPTPIIVVPPHHG